MTATASPPAADAPGRGLRHEGLLYAGIEEFLAATVPFLRDGCRAAEPALVLTSAPKVERLRDALGAESALVEFGDMAEEGANPAWIIPVWQDFVNRHAHRAGRLRGIGEPVWAERTPAELVECQRHEALINLALGDAPLWLVCPYDTGSLAPGAIGGAHQTHPTLRLEDTAWTSHDYADAEKFLSADWGLPAAKPPVVEVPFDGASLPSLRRIVSRQAARAGLGADRIADLVVSVNEVATNSLVHGGGRGLYRSWREDGTLVVEVEDDGSLADPMVGRVRPSRSTDATGMWLVSQLCDLVQVRSDPARGTVVRLHMDRRRRGRRRSLAGPQIA